MNLKISYIFPLSGTTPKKEGCCNWSLYLLNRFLLPNLNQLTLYRIKGPERVRITCFGLFLFNLFWPLGSVLGTRRGLGCVIKTLLFHVLAYKSFGSVRGSKRNTSLLSLCILYLTDKVFSCATAQTGAAEVVAIMHAGISIMCHHSISCS